MQFSIASVMTLVLGSGLSVHGYIPPRAFNKANEYPEEKWPKHQVFVPCISLDKTDVSACLFAMSGQRMLACSNQNCNPGTNGEDGLGDIGGGCAELDTHFTAGRIKSVTSRHQLFVRLERRYWQASKLSLPMPLKWRSMGSSRSRNKGALDMDSHGAEIEC
ncbi:uncharacterized protein EAF01_002375 [Botrytis porri]|uniref:uncharacterized protein n=1 Tax=Botrytis porri TaxID=87229 RepID=UPI0019016497|nr:uncharacterized protein EAF01_002375 [Botrytis porri]KAF7910866.1 hypothetical protein EAF01_002375 [Botrytis porri]